MIRARLLKRLSPSRREDVGEITSRERLAAASDDIRNALVPLKTVADLLQRSGDESSHSWCASIVRLEVDEILSILESLDEGP
ncbi:MAG: hypothetical protein ACREQQ_00230 [Candidatus Binatia bacterium]